MKKPKLVLLCSGGLDSYMAYYYAQAQGYDVFPMWVDLGQPYREKEAKSLLTFPFKVHPFKADFIRAPYNKVPTPQREIIPGRNLLLATMAASYGDLVWLTAYGYEMTAEALDKNAAFYRDTTKLLSQVFGRSIKVETPFASHTKADMVGWCVHVRHLSARDLSKTSSCFHPTDAKCGRCSACLKRYLAFACNGIIEPGYKINPTCTPAWKKLVTWAKHCHRIGNYAGIGARHVNEILWLSKKDGLIHA